MDDELIHAYDSAKRREYYLRNRNLKGRNHGSAVKGAPPKKTRAQRQAERRKKQQAQIAALKGRLEKLRNVLAAETKAAQIRSGVKTAKSADKESSSKQGDSSEKLTASEKAAKAKAAKKLREKNADPSLDQQIKSLTEKIKKVQERIMKMRKNGSLGVRKTQTK